MSIRSLAPATAAVLLLSFLVSSSLAFPPPGVRQTPAEKARAKVLKLFQGEKPVPAPKAELGEPAPAPGYKKSPPIRRFFLAVVVDGKKPGQKMVQEWISEMDRRHTKHTQKKPLPSFYYETKGETPKIVMGTQLGEKGRLEVFLSKHHWQNEHAGPPEWIAFPRFPAHHELVKKEREAAPAPPSK